MNFFKNLTIKIPWFSDIISPAWQTTLLFSWELAMLAAVICISLWAPGWWKLTSLIPAFFVALPPTKSTT